MRDDSQYFLAIRPTAASEWRVLVFTTAKERAFFGDDYEETHRNGQAVRAGRNDLSRFMEVKRKTGHLSVLEFAPFAMQFSDIVPVGEVGTCCCVGACDRVFRQGMEAGK